MSQHSAILGSRFTAALWATLLCSQASAMSSLPPTSREPLSAAQCDGSTAKQAQSAAPLSTPLDRSGVDRASVHWQILQQSKAGFAANNHSGDPKLPLDDKKTSSELISSNS